MNAAEFEDLFRRKADKANQIAERVAAGEPVPDDLLDDWKRLDNEVAARIGTDRQWEVSDGE